MTKALERKMEQAESYQDWMEAAQAHDEQSGLQKWKEKDETRRYDYAGIRKRVSLLKKLRRANQNHDLLFALNEGIHGNIGGMGRSDLYQQAKFGTKRLIGEYSKEVSRCLEHLAKPRLKGVNLEEKVDFFHRAQHCFGRSAFLMSGSGTFLFFHIGVLKTLWEQELIPEIISGSSGGAIIAAIAGSRPQNQLGKIFEPEFISIELELKSILNRLSIVGKSKIDQNEFQQTIAKAIPDLTFAEAYEISGLHINISVAPAEKHQTSRLLNSITSPNVMLREAVLASCCLPGVFEPVALAAKNVDGERVPYLRTRKWVDGSLSDDLPMKRLSRLYGVNHFIVSQTNPLALPFINPEKKRPGVIATLSNTGMKTIKDWGLAASYIAQKPLKSDSYFSKLLNGYISIVSQSYTGDINILPSKRFLNPTKALSAQSNKQILELIADGEKSTWPAVEKIRIQTHISRTLDKIVKKLDLDMLNKSKRAEAKSNLKLVKRA
ncbi:MAG: DUF3336 domain-containing protein [Acidiferrobacterales bacterium]|nr:DUF3336 domain-containing protein [Acidiferrobacterales bacterium]